MLGEYAGALIVWRNVSLAILCPKYTQLHTLSEILVSLTACRRTIRLHFQVSGTTKIYSIHLSDITYNILYSISGYLQSCFY
jgi:hypothetical protein